MKRTGRRFRRRREAVSALFDALLFFTIILAASDAMFLSASSLNSSAAEEAAGPSRYAADVQESALACSIGPVGYAVDGAAASFSGSALDAIRTILKSLRATPDCDLDALRAAVGRIYHSLVDRPYRFAVHAFLQCCDRFLFISDGTVPLSGIPDVRWTSSVPILVDGMEGELTLYLWR